MKIRVKITRGKVLTYNGKLIDAVYSHSNGDRCVSALCAAGKDREPCLNARNNARR